MPDISKLHTPEAIQKRKENLKNKQKRFFYDPETLEYAAFDIGLGECPPSNWLPGRKPVKKEVYVSCKQQWNVYKNGELFCRVGNLKQWSKENELIGLNHESAIYRKKVNERIVQVSEATNGLASTIIENGIDTGMTRKQYTKKIGRSEPWLCTTLRKGSFILCDFDVYTVEKAQK